MCVCVCVCVCVHMRVMFLCESTREREAGLPRDPGRTASVALGSEAELCCCRLDHLG